VQGFRRNDEKETKRRRKPYNMVKRYRKISVDAKEKIRKSLLPWRDFPSPSMGEGEGGGMSKILDDKESPF
jgi:hypothetical protein